MEMTPVESSHIVARGYDPATGKMRIQFRGGRTYESGNVTPEAYEAFVNAESAGRYWHQAFRGNKDYDFKPVPKEEENGW